MPLNAMYVRYDVAAPTSAGTTAWAALSSWYGTSSAKTAPVAGALKIAATPAAAPATSSTRLSAREKKRWNLSWTERPMLDPM